MKVKITGSTYGNEENLSLFTSYVHIFSDCYRFPALSEGNSAYILGRPEISEGLGSTSANLHPRVN